MSVRFTCANPSCKRPLTARGEDVGKRTKCPSCGNRQIVPMLTPTIEAPAEERPAKRKKRKRQHREGVDSLGGALLYGLITLIVAGSSIGLIFNLESVQQRTQVGCLALFLGGVSVWGIWSNLIPQSDAAGQTKAKSMIWLGLALAIALGCVVWILNCEAVLERTIVGCVTLALLTLCIHGIVGCSSDKLDDKQAKAAFWKAFKPLGPWWAELPPY